MLLDFGCDPNYQDKESNFKTALHVACISGNLKFVKALVEKGADTGPVDGDSKMPINYVEKKENAMQIRIYEYLVEKGSDLDWRDYWKKK